KGGVGKTTLAYHFSCMLAEMGSRVLAVDLDPQMNLTSMFLSEEQLEQLAAAHIERVYTPGASISDSGVFLLSGDLELSTFEDRLSDNWGKCLNRDVSAFRVTSAFYRIIEQS